MADPAELLLSNMMIFGREPLPVALPIYAPAELRRWVAAAIESYQAGYAGVDYVLKNYAHEWEFDETPTSPDEQAVHHLLTQARNEVGAVLGWVDSGEKTPEPVGLFAAYAALLRLKSTFAVAAMLARLGYRYECFTMCRLILEQTAWAFAVRVVNGEDIFNVPVTRSISSLKAVVPLCGRAYNKLSNFAHIHPELSKEYIDLGEGAKVTMRAMRWSPYLAWTVAYLADVFTLAAEAIFHAQAPGASRLVIAPDGTFAPSPDRPLYLSIQDHRTYATLEH